MAMVLASSKSLADYLHCKKYEDTPKKNRNASGLRHFPELALVSSSPEMPLDTISTVAQPCPSGTHCFSGRVSLLRKAIPPPQAMVKTTLPTRVLISAEMENDGYAEGTWMGATQKLSDRENWYLGSSMFGAIVAEKACWD